MPEKRKQVGTKLNPELYRQIKALALLQGLEAGELIDEIFKEYIAKHLTFTGSEDLTPAPNAEKQMNEVPTLIEQNAGKAQGIMVSVNKRRPRHYTWRPK